MKRAKVLTVVSLTLLGCGVAMTAHATPAILKEAKDAGMPAQNCQYCHVSKIPKKDGFTPNDLNERGKWLLGEKDKQKAQAIKGDWLKSYPGGKEQK